MVTLTDAVCPLCCYGTARTTSVSQSHNAGNFVACMSRPQYNLDRHVSVDESYTRHWQ
jgi:hypothetical protein